MASAWLQGSATANHRRALPCKDCVESGVSHRASWAGGAVRLAAISRTDVSDVMSGQPNSVIWQHVDYTKAHRDRTVRKTAGKAIASVRPTQSVINMVRKHVWGSGSDMCVCSPCGFCAHLTGSVRCCSHPRRYRRVKAVDDVEVASIRGKSCSEENRPAMTMPCSAKC